MPVLAVFVQDPTTTAAWVGPTIAISLAIVAAAVLVTLVGVFVAALVLQRSVRRVAGHVSAVLEAARRVADEGQSLVRLVREEGEGYAATSRRLRHRIDHGVDRMSERLADLDALADVVHEEVEETALRFASALRTARLSTGIIARVLRRRRRR